MNAERTQRRRKGQSMAEFALTLPIVLILMFGIIEFGRIFQAWVTLQNSARAAARYASTGVYNGTRYPLSEDPAGETTGLVPCVQPSHAQNGRGTKTTFDPDPGTPGDEVEVYQGGTEWLFATWYEGIDCDPRDEEHQEMRKDIARVLSIMDESRIASAGLSLEEAINWSMANPQNTPLYEVWRRPQPRSNQRSWFNTMICSTRPRRDAPDSGMYHERAVGGDVTTRFVTYLGDEQLRDQAGNVLNPPVPSCLLNEIPTADSISAGATNNAGSPWLDPGGAGDGVSIVVTFNHPLITPLGLTANGYVPIQARRVAVNESFRASRAVNALNTGPGSGIIPPTIAPSATNTASATASASRTPTSSPQASATPTVTATQPFSCNLITVGTVSFLNQGRITFQIDNQNPQDTSLVRVTLGWSKPAGFNNMYLSSMAINNQVHWLGNDPTPPTNSGPGGPGPEPGDQASADRTVYGSDISIWQAVFGNAPNNLGTYLSPSNFTPTEFVFQVPNTAQTCVKQFVAPTPTRTPTLPSNVTATRTPTPDCTANQINFVFSNFMSFGVVRVIITNNRNTPAILTGFNIAWVDRNAAMVVEQVTVGGSNPADPLSTRVWQGADNAPNTTSPGEGTWVSNYTVDAGSSVALYIDFGGTSGTLSSAFGATLADFNGSTFTFTGPNCGPVTVTTTTQNTPTPLPTSGPTSTPSNTFTPSNTPTVTPTTASPTPGPTATSTNTSAPPPPPPTNTVPPPPTVPGGGDSD